MKDIPETKHDIDEDCEDSSDDDDIQTGCQARVRGCEVLCGDQGILLDIL